MDSLDLIRDPVIVRFDGVVVELFLRSFDKSLRVPAAWLGVRVETGKRGAVTLEVGTVNTGDILYGPDLSLLGNYWPIDTTVEDEPSYRTFFTQVATAVSRQVSA